jgi:ribosome-binding factor A
VASRHNKLRKHIQRTLGEILHQEGDIPAGVLVTISNVEVTPNLHSAAIWLYIFPLERAEETLGLLKKQMYDLQGSFNRAVRMQPLPRLIFKIDHGASYAQHIDDQLEHLKTPEPPTTGLPDSSSPGS